MVRLGLWVFGRKSPEERCHSHIISRVFTPSTWHLTADADLEHPDEAMLIRLFHWKVTLFSPYHTALFGREVTVHSPQLRSGELCSVSLKVKCLQKLFGIHLHRQAVSSPHLFIQSFIYINRLTGIYFILWVIIQFYFIYFVLKWFQLWPLGALLFDSWVPLPCPIIMLWFFFWTTSLLCRTTGCSSHFACCLPQA